MVGSVGSSFQPILNTTGTVEVQEVLLCITGVKINIAILMVFSKDMELNVVI
jgi:hypothetical protein